MERQEGGEERRLLQLSAPGMGQDKPRQAALSPPQPQILFPMQQFGTLASPLNPNSETGVSSP